MLLNIKKILIFSIVLLNFTGFAQTVNERNTNLTHEFGLNVTSLLTDILGNSNRTNIGKYLITYKKLKGNTAFRLGAALNFNFSNENNGSDNVELLNQNFQLRMGKEWRHDISSKMQYYFGIDGVGGFSTEHSSANTVNGNIIQKDRTLSAGLGPVLGFQYAIFDKLLIGTEGSLYATVNQKKVTFETPSVSSLIIPNRKSSGVAIQTTLPTSIFLILKF